MSEGWIWAIVIGVVVVFAVFIEVWLDEIDP